jgi:hypothetical protein
MQKCANAPLLLLRIVEWIQGVPPPCLVYTVVQVLGLRDKLPERKQIVYKIMFPLFAVKKSSLGYKLEIRNKKTKFPSFGKRDKNVNCRYPHRPSCNFITVSKMAMKNCETS